MIIIKYIHSNNIKKKDLLFKYDTLLQIIELKYGYLVVYYNSYSN